MRSGGRRIYVTGHSLDVVQEPRMVVTVSPFESIDRRRRRRSRQQAEAKERPSGRSARMVPDPVCPRGPLCSVKQVCEGLFPS